MSNGVLEQAIKNTEGDLKESKLNASGTQNTPDDFSERQAEVLSCVLELMVEEGDGFSMAKVAKRASCSKETLYNWFKDRDGLLTATVRWQASRVKIPDMDASALDFETFRVGLAQFAQNWLEVISGDVSIALNRAAVTHAGSGKTNLGAIVLFNGPFAMARRLEPIFKLGQGAGLIVECDSQELFKTYFGLVVGDFQIRALLGDAKKPSKEQIKKSAVLAAEQFLSLYGADQTLKN
ncbi:MAG: TetR/AcrR family transcriptional regulator [Nitratireductor sp.]